jgi:2'-5' RNA ligase
MERKRIFIAVNLSNQIKENIKQKILAMCFRILPTNDKCPIKWVDIENMHITLKFLGYLESDKLITVEEILKEEMAGIKPFSMDLKTFGFLPEIGTPRVLWVGVEKGHKVLENLAESLEQNFSKRGFRKETHSNFTSHITLGRVKKHLNKDEKEGLLKIKDDLKHKSIGKFKVLSIDIMESKLSPKGPKYSIVESLQLKS